jgi:hypothetical protein
LNKNTRNGEEKINRFVMRIILIKGEVIENKTRSGRKVLYSKGELKLD